MAVPTSADTADGSAARAASSAAVVARARTVGGAGDRSTTATGGGAAAGTRGAGPVDTPTSRNRIIGTRATLATLLPLET
jgi:hypothetical protein